MRKAYILLLGTLLACACTNRHGGDQITTTSDETPGPVVQLHSFPLLVGHVWVYDNGDTLQAVSDTVINGSTAVKMVKINGTATEVSYYTNTSAGFYQAGTNSLYHALENPMGFIIDSPKFFSEPILLAQFPADTGVSWSSHDPAYEYYSRKWASYVTISAKAGKFNCIELISNSGAIEYYSDKGLVRVKTTVECFVAPCPTPTTTLVWTNF